MDRTQIVEAGQAQVMIIC